MIASLAEFWLAIAGSYGLVVAIVAVVVVAWVVRDVSRGQQMGPIWLAAAALFGVRWLLLPPDSLIIIDEWENLGAIAELVRGDPYRYRLLDIEGMEPMFRFLEYGPLLHGCAAPLVRMGLAPLTAAVLLNAAGYAALLPLTFLVVRALLDVDRRTAFGAALLVATLPVVNMLSRTASTDPLAMVVLLAGALCVIQVRERSMKRATRHGLIPLLGVCATALVAIFARLEFLVLLPMWGVAGMIAGWRPTRSHLVAAIGTAVLALPAALHLALADVHRKGAPALSEHLLHAITDGSVSAVVFATSPFAFPLWLTVAVVVGVQGWSRQKKAALLFAWLSIGWVYAQDPSSWENGSYLAKRSYHLGPAYLVALLAALPMLQSLRRPAIWLVAGLLLNVIGTGAQHAYYQSSYGKYGDVVLMRSLDLPEDAVVLTEISIQVRWNADRDHAEPWLALDGLIDHLERPIFLFEAKHYIGEHLPLFIEKGWRVEATEEPRLWRLFPPRDTMPDPEEPSEP